MPDLGGREIADRSPVCARIAIPMPHRLLFYGTLADP
jgi:hypothetical protein